MIESDRRYYRQAARHAALGWSATKSIKHFRLPRGTTSWEAARKGFSDMRTYLEMKEIAEQTAALSRAERLAEDRSGTLAGTRASAFPNPHGYWWPAMSIWDENGPVSSRVLEYVDFPSKREAVKRAQAILDAGFSASTNSTESETFNHRES